jgi:predicted transposase/invertase (TIGR01784 family)
MSAKNKQVKYLDPKNDLTFRKVFGERAHLMKSFLNSILPLEEGQLIEKVEYLEPELIPELPNLKRSIVDVHCTDNHDRYFIVEMQMYWTSAFKQRMLFNAGKAYVRQLESGEKYRKLRPVYGLSLVDDIFHTSKEMKDTFYHHYRMVHTEKTDEQIEGLELIFVELPKFKARNFTDKKMQTLWLRFLTEIDENTKEVPDDFAEAAEIQEALECVSKSAFTKKELLYYDQYWDAIRVEKAAIEELKIRNKDLTEENLFIQKKLMEAEKEKAQAQKREAQAQKREAEAKRKLAGKMKKYGDPIDEIKKETGLSEDEIKKL